MRTFLLSSCRGGYRSQMPGQFCFVVFIFLIRWPNYSSTHPADEEASSSMTTSKEKEWGAEPKRREENSIRISRSGTSRFPSTVFDSSGRGKKEPKTAFNFHRCFSGARRVPAGVTVATMDNVATRPGVCGLSSISLSFCQTSGRRRRLEVTQWSE